MRYLRILKQFLAVAVIVLLNPLVAAGHTSASPARTIRVHDVHAVGHHASGEAPACTSVCTTTTLKEDDNLFDVDVEDTDPALPRLLPNFDVQSRFATPKKLTGSSAFSRLVFRPPDLVTLYSNFRL